MNELTAQALAKWLKDSERPRPVLLDVREPWEVEVCQIGDSLSMPMNTVPDRLSELDPEAPIVCICHHGVRSLRVAEYLDKKGFSDVSNLRGGINAWAEEVDDSMPRY